jgi:hypothetical protein
MNLVTIVLFLPVGLLLALWARMRILAIAFAISAAGASSAFGQTNSTPAADSSTRIWRVGAGYETLWVRDVSRSGRPVDASPVTWEGRGPAVSVQFDRASVSRLHHFQFNAGWAGGFEFGTPLGKIPRSAAEKAVHLDGRYEYRRYPFRDLGPDGLDFGIGVEGGAVFRSLTQIFDPAIEARQRGTDVTAAVVVAGRLRRWRSVQLEAAWVNGMAVGRSSTHHSTAAETNRTAWGGGWLTDFTARADVRISDGVTLFTSYFTTGRGRYQSHGASTTGRGQFMLGVVYAR